MPGPSASMALYKSVYYCCYCSSYNHQPATQWSQTCRSRRRLVTGDIISLSKMSSSSCSSASCATLCLCCSYSALVTRSQYDNAGADLPTGRFWTHTHTRLMALFPGIPKWASTRKVKTNPDFTEARDSEWQRHQLGRMQVCTSLQTDNHASMPPLSSFLQAGCPSCHPTNSVKALKAKLASETYR